MGMSAVEWTTLTLLISILACLVQLLRYAKATVEGITHICAICNADLVEGNLPAPPPQPNFVRPTDMPHQQSLLDVISKPPELGNGTFGGRAPWVPPSEPEQPQ